MRSVVFVLTTVLALGVIAGACKSSSDTPSPASNLAATPTGGQMPAPSDTPASIGETPTEGATVGSFTENCQKSDEKQFASPETIIDTSKTYTATIKLEKGGEIVLELFSDVPITTNNFVFLACKGYYDGVTFHRVLPGFVAQGGDPTGSGSGGPGYSIPDEIDGDHNFNEAGVISMAKGGPNTTGSQFFITYAPTPNLESGFTVFGKVTAGTDVLNSITPRDPDQRPNFTGDAIQTITITEQ